MIMRYFIICLKKALRSIVCVCVEGGGGGGEGGNGGGGLT